MPNAQLILAHSKQVTDQALNLLSDVLFSNGVMDILNQSGASFQEVNTFYANMKHIIDGYGQDYPLNVAESQISSIISNRESLRSQASNLNAATPGSEKVKALLVAAYDASLVNDQGLSDCLYQENYGYVAYIYRSCINSTVSQSSAASAAKQTFKDAYNQFRTSIGQPPIDISF